MHFRGRDRKTLPEINFECLEWIIDSRTRRVDSGTDHHVFSWLTAPHGRTLNLHITVRHCTRTVAQSIRPIKVPKNSQRPLIRPTNCCPVVGLLLTDYKFQHFSTSVWRKGRKGNILFAGVVLDRTNGRRGSRIFERLPAALWSGAFSHFAASSRHDTALAVKGNFADQPVVTLTDDGRVRAPRRGTRYNSAARERKRSAKRPRLWCKSVKSRLMNAHREALSPALSPHLCTLRHVAPVCFTHAGVPVNGQSDLICSNFPGPSPSYDLTALYAVRNSGRVRRGLRPVERRASLQSEFKNRGN